MDEPYDHSRAKEDRRNRWLDRAMVTLHLDTNDALTLLGLLVVNHKDQFPALTNIIELQLREQLQAFFERPPA